MARLLLDDGPRGLYRNLGLLLIRVGLGAIIVASHGLTKLRLLGEGARFPDPIGLGSEFSLVLAFFAEVVCAALIGVGPTGTRCRSAEVRNAFDASGNRTRRTESGSGRLRCQRVRIGPAIALAVAGGGGPRLRSP